MLAAQRQMSDDERRFELLADLGAMIAREVELEAPLVVAHLALRRQHTPPAQEIQAALRVELGSTCRMAPSRAAIVPANAACARASSPSIASSLRRGSWW